MTTVASLRSPLLLLELKKRSVAAITYTNQYGGTTTGNWTSSTDSSRSSNYSYSWSNPFGTYTVTKNGYGTIQAVTQRSSAGTPVSASAIAAANAYASYLNGGGPARHAGLGAGKTLTSTVTQLTNTLTVTLGKIIAYPPKPGPTFCPAPCRPSPRLLQQMDDFLNDIFGSFPPADPTAGTTTGTLDTKYQDQQFYQRLKSTPSGAPDPEPKSFWGKVVDSVRRAMGYDSPDGGGGSPPGYSN